MRKNSLHPRAGLVGELNSHDLSFFFTNKEGWKCIEKRINLDYYTANMNSTSISWELWLNGNVISYIGYYNQLRRQDFSKRRASLFLNPGWVPVGDLPNSDNTCMILFSGWGAQASYGGRAHAPRLATPLNNSIHLELWRSWCGVVAPPSGWSFFFLSLSF